MNPLRQRMLEDLQIRHYAPTTIAAYIRGVAEFARHFGKSPDQLGPEDIRQYQLFLIKEKGVSLPAYIQVVCLQHTNLLRRGTLDTNLFVMLGAPAPTLAALKSPGCWDRPELHPASGSTPHG